MLPTNACAGGIAVLPTAIRGTLLQMESDVMELGAYCEQQKFGCDRVRGAGLRSLHHRHGRCISTVRDHGERSLRVPV